MDAFAKAALIGTTRHPPLPVQTDDPADSMFAEFASVESPRALLLRAGVRSVYHLAGGTSKPVPAMEEAPVEAGIPPTAELAAMLRMAFLPDCPLLLPEFLEMMSKAGIQFPASLLPIALNTNDPQRRAALTTVLGARARWLAGFNPDWSWVLESDTQAVFLPRLQTQFEEGSLQERCTALQRIRQLSPALGRQLLEAAFPLEKGDQRRKLLEQLRTNLSAEDEPFLVPLLRDRSKWVKETAGDLLSRIEGSEYAQRMRERALELIHSEQRGKDEFALRCELPEEVPVEWERDGLISQPPQGISMRSWRTHELISRVSPHVWIDTFHRAPEELLQAIADDEESDCVIAAWLSAVAGFQPFDPACSEWELPLWNAAVKRLAAPAGTTWPLMDSLRLLAERMSLENLEQALISFLKTGVDVSLFPFEIFVRRLHAPWSRELSELYLRVTRQMFQSRDDVGAYRWLQTLLPAAVGLAPASFESALQPWAVQDVRQTTQFQPQLQRFGEVIRGRHQFNNELARCRKLAGPSRNQNVSAD